MEIGKSQTLQGLVAVQSGKIRASVDCARGTRAQRYLWGGGHRTLINSGKSRHQAVPQDFLQAGLKELRSEVLVAGPTFQP